MDLTAEGVQLPVLSQTTFNSLELKGSMIREVPILRDNYQPTLHSKIDQLTVGSSTDTHIEN